MGMIEKIGNFAPKNGNTIMERKELDIQKHSMVRKAKLKQENLNLVNY